MDFTVIDRAGITQAQFGELIGVTRFTVNTWVNNKFKPRSALRGRVAAAIQALEDAIKLGQLPLPPYDPDARVKDALKKVSAAIASAGG